MSMFNYQCDENYQIIKDVSQNYPQLTTYEKEWLYLARNEYIPGEPVDLEYQTIQTNDTATVLNAIPYQYKSAILKGQTWVNLVDDTKNTKNKWVIYGEPTIDENGTWYFQSNSSSTRYAQQTIPIKNNTTYTAFLKCKNKNTNNNNAQIGLFLESSDGGSRIAATQENILSDDFVLLKCKITTTTHNSLTFRMQARGLIGEAWFKEPLFIEGDYIDQNIPYFEGMQSVEMPVLTTSNEDGTKTNILTVNEEVHLRRINDVQDELNLLTGELTQRVGEIVLDGNEEWYIKMNGENTIRYGMLLNDYKPNSKDSIANLNCDKIPAKPNREWSNDVEMIEGNWRNTEICVRLSREKANTLDDFKNWLNSNKPIMQYPLAKESIKTVDLTSLLDKPFEGINHYQVSSDTINPMFIAEVPIVSEGEQTLAEINQETYQNI